MVFHIQYSLSTEHRDASQARFKETGGLPPEGVTLKSRHHSINGNKGFLIAESSNIEAVGKWIQDWSDLMTFEVTPVLTDEQVSGVIG